MNMKKILSSILAFAMILSTMGTVVFAADGDVAQIGDVTYATLADAAAVAQAGDTITLIADATEDVELPAGVTLNGNNFSIDGSVFANGDLKIEGITKVKSFNAGWYNHTITIGQGASLQVTGTGRVTIGYGNIFNITGTITDAKTADKTAVVPSLVIPGGTSITGGNGAKMNVSNAYVVLGNSSSKNSAADGTFDLNFENSIIECTNQFTLSAPNAGYNPTFNVNIKDSVMTAVMKICLAAPGSNVVIDNSDVTTQNNLHNSGNLTIQNGASLTGGMIQFSENGGNAGTITVDNATLTINNDNKAHAMDGNGTGKLIVKNGGTANVDYIQESAIVVDGASQLTAKDFVSDVTVEVDLSTGSGSVTPIVLTDGSETSVELVENAVTEAINNVSEGVEATVDPSTGAITIVRNVAKVGDVYYVNLKDAINAAADNASETNPMTVQLMEGTFEVGTVKLPATLKNVTIKGADNHGTILKNSSINGADGNQGNVYHDVTIDGIDFDNSKITITAIYDGAYLKNIAIMNCKFHDLVNNAAITINTNGKPFEGFVLTGNVINNITTTDFQNIKPSGVVVRKNLYGDIVIANNNISDVVWNAIQVVGIQESANVTVTGNTLASNGSSVLNLSGVESGIVYENNTINALPGQWATTFIPDAKIGEKSYSSLQAALDFANVGETVLLINDVEEDVTIKAPAIALLSADGITLDLNQKTLKGNITVEAGANTSIINGKIVNDDATVGAINAAGIAYLSNLEVQSAGNAVAVADTGAAEITDGTYDAAEGYAAVVASDNGEASITGGFFSSDVSDYVASGYACKQDEYGNYTVSAVTAGNGTAVTEKVEVVLVPVEDDATKYDIVLKADTDKAIHRFLSAELDIQLTEVDGTLSVQTVTGNDDLKIEAIDPQYTDFYGTADETVWGFHLDENAEEITKNEIKVGTVVLTGIGTGKLAVVANEKNKVEAIQSVEGNIVKKYVGADSTLVIDEDAVVNPVEVKPVTKTLTIQITFPNNISDNNILYQDMTVTVDGKDIETQTYELGADGAYTLSDNKYVITIPELLVKDHAYNIQVKGAGYRTANYRVTMTEDKTVYFWNDAVKGDPIAYEEGSKVKVNANFLAGDIAEDNIIDKYDLAAVVSYFGKYDMDTTGVNTYAKYDLNRDGNIDSEDIAYVLASFGY